MSRTRRGSRSRQPNTNKSTSHIRIIAGKHRGRKLPVLDAQGLRPTTDRVKETVFNWLMPYVQDSVCLDCFAGAGSLGFEALSRGAEKVTMLELNNTAAQQLSANKTLLNADNIDIHHTDAIQYLSSVGEQYNLVFIDPPFRQGLAQQSIDKLAGNNWLAENAIIYVEIESEASAPQVPSHWQLLKEKSAGQVSYRLYQA